MNIRISLLVLFLTIATACTGYRSQWQGRQVYLHLDRPHARQVALASSLDGFTPHPAVRDANGRWTATVPSNGEFTYFFIVDRQVVTPCRILEKDDFGGVNCVFDGMQP